MNPCVCSEKDRDKILIIIMKILVQVFLTEDCKQRSNKETNCAESSCGSDKVY